MYSKHYRPTFGGDNMTIVHKHFAKRASFLSYLLHFPIWARQDFTAHVGAELVITIATPNFAHN
jgi:hypothetical protein